jgi:hypothetical protein
VRYLHLNPLRAGVVESLAALDRYPWSGHSTLMGRFARPWQAAAEVLERFGPTLRPARSRYREFMRAGVSRGRCPELQGGGLRRSAGGWEAVALLCRGREQWAADERILGSGPFVEQILRETAPPAPRFPRAQAVAALPDLVQRCGAAFGVDPGEVYGGSRRRTVGQARAVVSYLAVSHLGLSAAAVAGTLGVTPAVVLRGVHRGRRTLAIQRLRSGELLPSPKQKV